MEEVQREFDLIYTGLKCSLTEIGGPDGERETLANCGDGRGEGVDKFISVSRDLALFKCRPIPGSSLSIIARADSRSLGNPTRVPSSRYHALRARPGTSDR